MIFVFFTQKEAYEMRISDWSSDVCSSDLKELRRRESFVQQGALRLGALEGKTALGPIVCHQDSPVRCRAASRECGERRGAIFKGKGAGGGHAAARLDVTQPRVRADRKSTRLNSSH